MAKLKKKDNIYFSEGRENSEIETAMEIMRSLEGVAGLVKAQGNDKEMNVEIEIAEEKVLSIKNYYVRRVVLDKIDEVKNLFVS